MSTNHGDDQSSFDLGKTALTRRGLLKGAAALGAAAALGPLISACGSTGGSTSTSSATAAALGSPKMGGKLRLGVTGGGSRDVLDLHQAYTWADGVRGTQLFDGLMTHDHEFKVVNALAEEVVAKDTKGLVWTIRVKPDVVFHNGKSLTADDVIYTFKRILDPKYPNSAASTISDIDPKLLKKLDERTVEVHMKTPNAVLDAMLAEYKMGIVPVGYDMQKPVGTGPFKYQYFKPGDRSIFPANKDYWGDGPYVDQVETIDFSDETAEVNALMTGAVDAAGQIPPAQVSVVTADQKFATVINKTGSWPSFFMRVDLKPYSDVRVRQAFRLITDRPKMIELAFGGMGWLANDMYAPYDPAYPKDFPQRVQDIEQAKSLLQQAGYANSLSVQCDTAPLSVGAVESAQVFAEQAKAAGVTVAVKKYDVATYYGEKLFTYPFGVDYYFTRNFLAQARINQVWNQPHWEDKEFLALVAQAFATVDSAKRNEVIREAYKILYDRGGWHHWGFSSLADAHSVKVAGFVPDAYGIPFNCGKVNQVWFT